MDLQKIRFRWLWYRVRNMDKKINLKQLGKNQWLIILLVGVLLVVIALPTDNKQDIAEDDSSLDSSQRSASAVQSDDKNTWDNYRETVESQLEEILSQVEGVGKVKVMVTLAGTGEMVVEKDIPQTQSQVEEGDSSGGTRTTKENSWEEATVYVQEDGNSVPYVVKELVPDIEGVCVIAQGGANGNVAQNISDAVQALFPIEVHKIKVMKMK